MRYGALRGFVNSKQLHRQHTLRECTVIVDADSYFHGTYRHESGCNYILGPECDRYAAYLRKNLSLFKKSDITCYFIFKGGANTDLDKREFIHQKVIDRANAFHSGEEDVYYEPILLSNVRKQVLKELGIKFYVTVFDHTETLIQLSQLLNCPVITYNIELCLFGVSIIEKRIKFNKETNSFACKLYKSAEIRKLFNFYNNTMIALVLTLVDEESKFFDNLYTALFNHSYYLLPAVLCWLRNKTPEMATQIAMGILTESEKNAFLKCYSKQQHLIDIGMNKTVTTLRDFLTKHDKDWFEQAVWAGRIPGVYVPLIKNHSLSGSWLIFDSSKDDAILTIVDIVTYVHALLADNSKLKVTFIGRKQEHVCVSEIENELCISNSKGSLFESNNELNATQQTIEVFKKFVDKIMAGFDLDMLQTVPDDCWILIITLVYFYSKTNADITYAYSVVLSYVMIGPVTNKMGLINHENLNIKLRDPKDLEDNSEEKLLYKDCLIAADVFVDLFYIRDLKSIFCRKTLHNFSVLSHCLQHMNYLNTICGEKIPCTIYGKCYNATFMYNIFTKIKDSKNPMEYFEKLLSDSPSVLLFFKSVMNTFNDCLMSVRNH